MTIEAAHHHIVLQAVILWSVLVVGLFVIGVRVFLIGEDVKELKDKLEKKDDES